MVEYFGPRDLVMGRAVGIREYRSTEYGPHEREQRGKYSNVVAEREEYC